MSENNNNNNFIKGYDQNHKHNYETMSLSTLNKKDTQIKNFKKLDTERNWSLNLCNMDIPSKIKNKK